jgi:diguanylate cyclase (GGDEF)-like protein
MDGSVSPSLAVARLRELRMLARVNSLALAVTVLLFMDGRPAAAFPPDLPSTAPLWASLFGGVLLAAAGAAYVVLQRLSRAASYDSLTGLPNRALLHKCLRQAVRPVSGQIPLVALVLMDLDRFREINDTFGHSRGDRVLQQIGQRLRAVVPASGTIARLGGDEFALLLPGMDTDRVVQLIQMVNKALEEPFLVGELSLAVDASIGIALAPDHGTNADHLLQRADIAMYLAKENGSGHAIYAPGSDPHSPRRLALMGQLRGAIERDELVLYYQPKISLYTQAVTGAEALVRWRHPEFGLVPPNDFIGPAERSGLITPLTAWSLKAALRQCPPGITVAVNLSRRLLHDRRIVDLVAESLQSSNVPPSRLTLEITESAIMADPRRATEILHHLHQMGVQLSIDDFGTGYSSMASLKKLPIHEIKIDGVFVKDMAMNEDGATIVRSIVDLAYTLGKEVVAEGVEDQKTLEQLVAMGCHGAQGFYMSKPLPHEEFLRWIDTSTWKVRKEPPSARRLTILVADDDPDTLATLGFRLQERGYHVLMANDGVEALDLARRFRPNLVVLDAMMPKENGYRVCRMLKEDERAGKNATKLPVILITGRILKSEPFTEQRFMDFSHADDIVYKPFEMDCLLDSIGRLLPR